METIRKKYRMRKNFVDNFSWIRGAKNKPLWLGFIRNAKKIKEKVSVM